MNEEFPLVSVGIPTFNRPVGLKRTLDYILSQDYINIEIVVSDNCSSDLKVIEIAKSYSEKNNRIKFYKQEANKGPIFNFEFVFKKSQGLLFMWASDDDEWRPDFISSCVNKHLFGGKFGLVFCQYSMKSAAYRLLGGIKGRVDFGFMELDEANQRVARYVMLPEISHKANWIYGLWKREILEKVYIKIRELSFDEKDLNIGIDIIMIVIALNYQKAGYIPKRLFFKHYQGVVPGSKLGWVIPWRKKLTYIKAWLAYASVDKLYKSYLRHLELLRVVLTEFEFCQPYINELLTKKKIAYSGFPLKKYFKIKWRNVSNFRN